MGGRLSIDTTESVLAGTVRLEAQCYTEDFLPNITAGVHDALWILTQQWRIGEFKGEDAGTLIKSRIETRSTYLNRFQSRNGQSAEAFDTEVPLEAKVERLPLIFDLGMQLEIGRQWYKILKNNGIQNQYAYYLQEFPIVEESTPNVDARIKSNRNSIQIRNAISTSIINGGALFNHVFTDLNKTYQNIPGLPSPQTPAMANAHDEFERWARNTYYWPENESDNSWHNRHLEYQFSISAPLTTNSNSAQHVFRGDQYMTGTVDWYSVDVERDSTSKLQESGTPISNNVIMPTNVLSYLPHPIDFKGMPKGRWWEFEDRNIDIARMLTQRQDLSKLIMMEFGLNYSNDWFIIPHVVENGTLTEVLDLKATDVFGKTITINRVDNNISQFPQDKWDMFNNSRNVIVPEPQTSFGKLLLMPSLIDRMEGEPLEKVVFLRDEMANMSWAIEEIVPDDLFGGRTGKEAANELLAYLRGDSYSPVPYILKPNNAKLRYKLINNEVPEYWIPFVPAQQGSSVNGRSIVLQRAAMLRYIDENDQEPQRIRPRTSLLSEPAPYYIYEEELSNAGFVVTTTFQRTRWYDGSTFVWVGRKKQTGRGEASSGLLFDTLVNKTTSS